MKLHLSPKFSLPSEAVTETFAILAKRGVGKTYTAKKMAEQMLKAAAAPVLIADPIGVWWGLRSAADGKGPGLPILVLGGDYGDAPLEAGAGEIVARMLVEERLSAVLDLSKFRKNEQTQFMTAFAERLYHDNREALHLMLDEADAFAPQKPYKGQERLLGAIEDLVRRGRARGIGVTLITQRAAVINKDVLTQAEVLIALRTIAPQDRAAIEAWIRVHGTTEQGDELMASLPSLPVGTAWFWSPGWLDVFQRVEIAPIETFDSSATPKAGQAKKKPKNLAEVDIPAVRERLAATIEKAKAEDPRLLRAEITRLQKELAKHSAPRSAPAPAKPDPAVLERAEKRGYQLAVAEAKRAWLPLQRAAEKAVESLQRAIPAELEWNAAVIPPNTTAVSKAVVDSGPVARKPQPPFTTRTQDSALGAERKVLRALAQRHPMRVTVRQLATLAGLAPSGGTYSTYLSRLRTAGYLEEQNGFVTCSPDGLAAADVTPAMPATAEETLAMWRGNVGAARKLLDVLAEHYPHFISRQELAEQADLAAGAGTFTTYLSRLRSNGLIEEDQEGLRLAAFLFEGWPA